MDNPEEVLHILDEFAKLKPKDIPKELEDYLSYVARTGDPVYQWSLVKCLFREKLLRVITDFYESSTLINPPSPAVDNFNYEAMKRVLLERLETFSNAPFTVQRLCELLTAPRKQYNRTDKFMRAIEKNILVVSTREPGSACRQDNASTEPLPNGVSDGESISQTVKNETILLAEAQMNESKDNALNDECHVDIGSVDPISDGCEEDVLPKDLDPIKLDHNGDPAALEEDRCKTIANSEAIGVECHVDIGSVDPISNDCEEDVLPKDLDPIKLDHSRDPAALEEDSCKTTASSEPIGVDQNELVENSEPSDKPDLVTTIEQEVVKSETELTESVKEDVVLNTNKIVCESKSDNANAEQVNDSSEAVGKPLVEESDVSCSTSDSTTWSNALPEEQDDVSTTEALSLAPSSNIEQGEAVSVEEAVEATSSEDSKVMPESSETTNVVAEKPSESVETFKDIGSSSDTVISSESDTREEDGVGTTDKVPVEEPLAESSEESPKKSPESEEINQPEESSGIPAEVEVVAVTETSIPEAKVEETAELPVVTSENTSKDCKTADVSSASETCPKEEPKEALPAVPEEAMEIDETNSCHSTAAVTETEEMTIADQSEPMDDSE